MEEKLSIYKAQNKVTSKNLQLKDIFDKTLDNIDLCIQKKTIHNLYFNLDKLNELLYSQTILNYQGKAVEDFGSDSEVEETNEDKPINGKKVVVQNGMRTILSALDAGAQYLYKDYLESKEKIPLYVDGVYCETNSALRILSKFNVHKKVAEKAEIMIHDANACVSNGKPTPCPDEEQLSKTKVMIVDTTSASIAKHVEWVRRFKHYTSMKTLFFVSSGLKNEQGGADKNPYGTIRVFAKNKETRESILKFIREKEEPIKSGISHEHRHKMKELGNTVCNEAIIRSLKRK